MGAGTGTSSAWTEYCEAFAATDAYRNLQRLRSSVLMRQRRCLPSVALCVAKADAGPALRRAAHVSLFPHWGELVKQHMTVELTDQAGPIEAAALLAGVKPAVWDAAFPPETPVKGQPVPEWQGRQWRTFDARKVHDLGKAVHLATMYASPTSPPMPADHPLAGPLAELSGRYYRIEQLTEFATTHLRRVAHDRRPR